MPSSNVIAPLRGLEFVDDKGIPLPRAMAWIEGVSSAIDASGISLEARVIILESLVATYAKIDATDSPYSAGINEYITADMSLGDVVVVLPSAGLTTVSRSGVQNTLTIQGIVNGVTNPEIYSDSDAPSMAFIDTEWRYV